MTDQNQAEYDLTAELSVAEKLSLETAQIPWRELQKYFAAGMAVGVEQGLDLLAVAAAMNKDDASQVSKWMDDGALAQVSDEQALAWYENDTAVWAVVIKPWILVQAIPAQA